MLLDRARTRRRGRRRPARAGTRSRPWRPAIASCDCVPASKRCPGGSSAAGPHAVGGQRLGEIGPDRRDAEVRPEELVRRAEHDVEAQLARAAAAGAARSARRRPRRARRRECAAAAIRAASGIEPTALEARVKATTRVRSPMSSSSASRSSVTSSARSGAVRTTSSWSFAATSSQGETFASWSSAVTTISSPGSSVRATAWASWKFSVVMFAPNAMPSSSAPMKSAAAARPRSITSSDCARGGEGPAEVRVRVAQAAVIASTTCLRDLRAAGPSKKAAPEASAGKRERTASRSSKARATISADDGVAGAKAALWDWQTAALKGGSGGGSVT